MTTKLSSLPAVVDGPLFTSVKLKPTQHKLYDTDQSEVGKVEEMKHISQSLVRKPEETVVSVSQPVAMKANETVAPVSVVKSDDKVGQSFSIKPSERTTSPKPDKPSIVEDSTAKTSEHSDSLDGNANSRGHYLITDEKKRKAPVLGAVSQSSSVQNKPASLPINPEYDAKLAVPSISNASVTDTTVAESVIESAEKTTTGSVRALRGRFSKAPAPPVPSSVVEREVVISEKSTNAERVSGQSENGVAPVVRDENVPEIVEKTLSGEREIQVKVSVVSGCIC